jgi:hypothetical protein
MAQVQVQAGSAGRAEPPAAGQRPPLVVPQYRFIRSV